MILYVPEDIIISLDPPSIDVRRFGPSSPVDGAAKVFYDALINKLKAKSRWRWKSLATLVGGRCFAVNFYAASTLYPLYRAPCYVPTVAPGRQGLGTDLITADLWLSSEGRPMRQLLNNYIIYNKPYVLHVDSCC